MSDENVIDNYLLWELCKKQGVQKKIVESSTSGEELKEEIIEKVKQEYLEDDYSFDEKVEKLRELDNNPDYRSKVFEEHSWKKEAVKIEDLGTTLPRLGDLPPEIITKSLPEVVKFVKEANPEEYKNVKYIKSLTEFPKVLNHFYPWIVTPGNRKSKQKRMKKVHGEKDWEIEETWGMINDGNHRAIAKILANDLEEIECYVGR